MILDWVVTLSKEREDAVKDVFAITEIEEDKVEINMVVLSLDEEELRENSVIAESACVASGRSGSENISILSPTAR